MSKNADRIVELYARRYELEKELTLIKAKLSSIALACEDRDIRSVQSGRTRLKICSHVRAVYEGDGSAASVLHDLGLDHLVSKTPHGVKVANHLTREHGVGPGGFVTISQKGKTVGKFTLKRSAWFMNVKARRSGKPRKK